MEVDKTKCLKIQDRLTFTGSSDKDVAYAKTFWKSVQLLPPMESRLVSSHISQRLRTAGTAPSTSGSVKAAETRLEKFTDKEMQQNLKQYEKERCAKNKEKILMRRAADLSMRQKQKLNRMKLENASGQQRVMASCEDAENDLNTEDMREIEAVANLAS